MLSQMSPSSKSSKMWTAAPKLVAFEHLGRFAAMISLMDGYADAGL